MTDQNYRYIVHLKPGDIIHLGGIPYELYGVADVGGNSKPGPVFDFTAVSDKELEVLGNESNDGF